jgi:hypothetical protein
VIAALAILLTLAVVGILIHPLLAGKFAPMNSSGDELTDAQHRKRMALLALRDVEYDYHAGKLDDEDYALLKSQVSAEALAALDEEIVGAQRAGSRGSPGVDPRLEAEIAAIRASIREGAVCPHCANPNPPGSRFCQSCGAALTGAVPGAVDGGLRASP